MNQRTLHKLALMGKTLCKGSLETMMKSWSVFELCCAAEKEMALNRDVLVWSDIDPNIKDKIGLPQEDVGIDYMDRECSFAGQAKFYESTSYVKASDIDRTRLCAYRAIKHAKDLSILSSIEIVTTENTKLCRSKITMDDVVHKTLSQERMREMCSQAMEIEYVPEKELVSEIEEELRVCQIKALENIIPGRVNRIRMTCGSGKTKVALEVIRRKIGTYLVLVPSIILLEQWSDYLKQFEMNVYMIGTGYDDIIKKGKVGETNVIVCVYNSYEKAFYNQTIKRKFEYIIVDEAHHLDFEDNLEEETEEISRNKKIWELIKDNTSVMLSASLGGNNHYAYSLRDAINDGVCCDYDVRIAHFDITPTMASIAKYILDNPIYLSILAYCNSIASARKLAAACRAIGISSKAISCEESMKFRQNIIKEFEEGKIRVLCSVNTLGEGINIRCADTCLFAEPRSSDISISQCIGRVSRVCLGKSMAHVVICTQMGKEEELSNHPIINILRALSKDDAEFVRKVVSKKSSYLRLENICDEHLISKEESKVEWIWDDVYDSMMNIVSRGDFTLKFEMLRKFYEDNKRLPTQREPIGSFLQNLRQATKGKGRHKITDEQMRLMNETFPRWLITNKTDEARNENVRKLIEMYKDKRLPIRTEIMGDFLHDLRCASKGRGSHKITDEQMRLMNEAFPGWLITYQTDEAKNENVRKLIEMYKDKKLPTLKEPMGMFLNKLRHAAKGKGSHKITDEQVRLMNESFPGWLNTNRTNEAKNEKVRKLIEMYKDKKLPTQRESMGIFLNDLRRAARGNGNYKITDDQMKLMNEAFPGWY